MGAGAYPLTYGPSSRQQTAQGAVSVGDLWQQPDGRAAVYGSATSAAASGDLTQWNAALNVTVPKVSGKVILDGGRLYWDRANNYATPFNPGGRGFYAGRAIGNAASGDATCAVALNTDPRYDRELTRDPFRSALVGTQAAGGFGGPYPRGSALKLLLDATSEAQKVDALGKDSFLVTAKGILEFGVEVVSVGSGGAPDFNIGIASGTHATDFDSIAAHLALHVDGNSLTAKVQSKDGTHTTAATTTGTALVAGVRSEFCFDFRIPAAVVLYQDGVQVLGGTTFNISSATTLYLIAHLEKTSAADTFEVDVDWLRLRLMEQG